MRAWASVSDPVNQHTKEHMQQINGTPKTPRHSRREVENHRRDTTIKYCEPRCDLSWHGPKLHARTKCWTALMLIISNTNNTDCHLLITTSTTDYRKWLGFFCGCAGSEARFIWFYSRIKGALLLRTLITDLHWPLLFVVYLITFPLLLIWLLKLGGWYFAGPSPARQNGVPY